VQTYSLFFPQYDAFVDFKKNLRYKELGIQN